MKILAEVTEYEHSSMPILYVKDQARSRDFYTSLLGIKPYLDVPGMVEFTLSNGFRFGLMPRKGIERILNLKIGEHTRMNAEFYLIVDDPIRYYNLAVTLGAQGLKEPAWMDWGAIVGYVEDPDGYVLAFANPSR